MAAGLLPASSGHLCGAVGTKGSALLKKRDFGKWTGGSSLNDMIKKDDKEEDKAFDLKTKDIFLRK